VIIIELAYSFHLGSDKNKRNTSRSSAKSNRSGSTSLSNNAIQNSAGLTKVDKHNYRKYDNNQNDIEIIKANYQNTSREKSMVVKVTDKTLLEKTGGIVQGMSGSPIIQNGKLIGAITHVFINDPTKGYGIYLDWMIDN